MKKIIERMRRLFAHGVWAANDTLVGIHPEGAINCVAGGTIVRNRLAVRLLGNAAGTVVGIAAEAVAQGDALYEAANGKVGKTEGGYFIGYALCAASADGEVEIQHCVPQEVSAS